MHSDAFKLLMVDMFSFWPQQLGQARVTMLIMHKAHFWYKFFDLVSYTFFLNFTKMPCEV